MDSITVDLTDDKDGDGIISWGDTVTAVVTTDVPTPWVQLVVHQDGELVAEGWKGSQELNYSFGLYSPIWTGGAAQATLKLFDEIPRHKHSKPLATHDFPVAA